MLKEQIQPGDTRHVEILDLLRGFAALGVVMVHFGGLGFLDNDTLTRIFFYGKYGVHVFFVISGFVIPLSLYNSGYRTSLFPTFIAKRFLRISLPYYAAVIMIVVQHLVSGYEGKEAHFETGRFVSHFLYVVPFTSWKFYDPVFWTLTVEFQFYIIIGLIYAAVTSSSRIIPLLLLILAAGSFYLPFENAEFIVFRYNTLFALGILCFLFYTGKMGSASFYLLCALVLALCFCQLGTEVVLAGGISVLCIIFARFRSRLTDYLGKISYSLYLTHNFMRLFLFVLLKRLMPDPSPGYKLIYLVFMVACAIIFAHIFHVLIERPATRLSKKIGERKE